MGKEVAWVEGKKKRKLLWNDALRRGLLIWKIEKRKKKATM